MVAGEQHCLQLHGEDVGDVARQLAMITGSCKSLHEAFGVGCPWGGRL